MKLNSILPVALLMMAVSACQNENEPNLAYQNDPDAVKINPTIHTLQSRVNTTGNGDTWTNGDQIKVNMVSGNTAGGTNSAVYKYTNSSWTLQGSDYMKWPDNDNRCTFEAFYPYAKGSSNSYTRFVIPSDQSTEEKIKSADWMLASTSTDKVESVNLPFTHQLAKITVKITQYGSAYRPIPTIKDPWFLKPSVTITPKGTDIFVEGYVGKIRGLMKEDKSAAKHHSFSVIQIPGLYNENSEFLRLNVNGEVVSVQTGTNRILTSIGIKSGKAYTFNLVMGSSNDPSGSSITIGDVTIEDWVPGNWQGEQGGDAEETTDE